MKRILLVALGATVITAMSFAVNTADITVSGLVSQPNPSITFNQSSMALGTIYLGEAISAPAGKTMTLIAPNASAAANNVTVSVASSNTNWRGIDNLLISSSSPSIVSQVIPLDATPTVLSQVFPAAVSPGTEYPLTFAFDAADVPTSTGTISEIITFTATYQ